MEGRQTTSQVKRKIIPSPNDSKPIKRRKITLAADLEKPLPIKKNVSLKGKARLRLKIKEQSICITQKNQREKQLLNDLQRLKAERTRDNHILGIIDRHWNQLSADLENIYTDLCGETTHNEQTSLFSLISAHTQIPTPDDTDDENEEWTEELEQKIEDRIKQTKALMKRVSGFLKVLMDSQVKILKQAEDSSIESELREKFTLLSQQVERLRAQVQKKQEEVAKLRQSTSELEDRSKTLKQNTVWLEEQNELIATAYKRLIRTNMYNDSIPKPPPSPVSPSEEKKKSSSDAETDETMVKAHLAEIDSLKKEILSAKADVTRLQNENMDLNTRIVSTQKQYNQKDLEIRVLKSDKELSEDTFHQAKASHDSSMGILASNHKQQVEELEKKLEQSARDIVELQSEKKALQFNVEKCNVACKQALVKTLEIRDLEQQKTIEKLRTENERMREQIGNKDLQVKLKELQDDIQRKDLEVKSLKALIKTPEVLAQAMYKQQINRLKHKARSLEEEINELKRNTQAKKLHSLEKNMDILSAEVDRCAKEYAQLQQESEQKENEHIKQIKSLTDANSHLQNLNATYNYSLKRLNAENTASKQNIDAQHRVQAKQKVYISKLQEQLRTLCQRNDALNVNANTSQQASQVLRDSLISLTQKYYFVKAEMEHKTELGNQLKLELEKKQQQLTKVENQSRSFQEKYNKQKGALKQVRDFMKNGTAGTDMVLQKQLQIARRRLSCSLCTINRKDTIIVRCLHMFCSKCVHSHFASRNRKCPQCKQAFGKTDIKDIGFNF